MDTSKNEMVGYVIGTNETVEYFNSTANSTLLPVPNNGIQP